MNLVNIKGKLSRAEMNNIMSGNGGGGAYCISEYGYNCGPANLCCYPIVCYQMAQIAALFVWRGKLI